MSAHPAVSPSATSGSCDTRAPERTLTLTNAAPAGLPALRSAATAAAALLDLPMPARWRWTVEAGGGRPPQAWLDVSSLDIPHTTAALAAAHTALSMTMRCLTWSETGDRTGTDLPVRADLVTGGRHAGSRGADAGGAPSNDARDRDDTPMGLVTAGPDLLLPLWAGIQDSPARIRLQLTLRAPAERGRPPQGSLTVAGTSSTVLVVAGVLAAGLSDGPGEITAVPGRPRPALLRLTTTRIGRCLAAPCLFTPGWPPIQAPEDRALRLHRIRQLMEQRIDDLIGQEPEGTRDR